MRQYRPICLEEIGLKLCASIMLAMARLSAEVGAGETQRPKNDEGSNTCSSCNPRRFADWRGHRKGKYLPITQAGFRKGPSTRDNSFALRTLVNLAIELGQRLTVTFLGLRQAFDSVSHACLEEAPRDAGASDKSIGMFRAIYAIMAKGSVRVTGADGTRKSSREFNIGRGVHRAICYLRCTSL